jgi:capsular polysaccharide export protein
VRGKLNVTGSGRSYLFLQGLAARFFENLGTALAARGHSVHRVNFNGGDRAFWRLPGAVDFRGRAEEWPSFLATRIAAARTSDIILFGDCRPPHRAAIEVARRLRVRVWVVEEGYLRPDWITFEEDGVNGFSTLPGDPQWYRDEARRLPAWQDPPSAPGRFRRRAAEDVLYWLASLAAARRFPHYATHRPYFQFIEYAGWLRRLALQRRDERRAAAAIVDLARCRDPVFLFPLQLDCDYQMRVHSPFRSVRAAIETVLTSFARHAPAAARLVVKLHPFDSGIYDWAGMTRHSAVALGVSERLIILDGGAIDRALALCRGVVTVNSTVGTLALAAGRPVIALGKAIYDMPGLTFQGDLDEFWHAAGPPDPFLFDAFRRVLAARALLPGSFFSKEGLRLAVDAAIGRLEAAARPAREEGFPTPLAAE